MTIKQEQREEHLEYLTSNLCKLGSDNDLRLGQMIEIITHDKGIDLFNIENDKLNELLLEYLGSNQQLIKEG